jgi:hypothetical protein
MDLHFLPQTHYLQCLLRQKLKAPLIVGAL